MNERTARQRLEEWAPSTAGLEHFGYKRESDLSAGSIWGIRIEISQTAPVSVVVLGTGITIEKACVDAIEGLSEFGIDVPA